MKTFEDYNKLNKKELINLLIEKDKTVKSLEDRLEKLEEQFNKSDVSRITEQVTRLERSTYQQQQYSI